MSKASREHGARADVNNLAYATRLGLWGPETAFANREAFVADIRDGGIAAMELVARDLKSLGLYTARALSFAGVEYEILEHRLSEDQIAVYDAYAEAWAIIHANYFAADNYYTRADAERNAGMKRSALETVDLLRDAAAKGQAKDRLAPAPERKPPELDRTITKPFEIGI